MKMEMRGFKLSQAFNSQQSYSFSVTGCTNVVSQNTIKDPHGHAVQEAPLPPKGKKALLKLCSTTFWVDFKFKLVQNL